MSKPTRLFFSYSFTHRSDHRDNYLLLKELLQNNGFSCYSFVFDFTEQVDNKKLMTEALREIDNSAIFIADPSFGSFGIGIEAGYAKAKNKTIIYFHKEGSPLEETLEGISDAVVDYSNTSDILSWFNKNLNNLKSNKI